MKILQLLLALLFTVTLSAQDRKIEFRDLTFDEALAAAKKESKPIFMDCYTVWCGPCKWMSANIFTNNTVADYYNENFVCVKFDMEKGEGLDIAKEFGIRAYPTLIFVNGERQLVMKTIGANQEIEPYIEMGENARSEEYNLVALAENVGKKRDNAEFMAKYFEIMSGADMVEPSEVTRYFSSIPKSEWTTEENVNIIVSVVEDIKSDVFQDVLARTDAYREVNPIIDRYVDYMVRNALMSKLYSRDPNARKEYDALYAEVESWDFDGKEAVLFSVESARLKRQSPEEYLAYCVDNVETYIWENAGELNNVAWYFFENTTEKEYLEEAEKWAAQAVELSPEHHILDTYGNLLFANGKYEQALEIELAALDKAKEEGADTSSYEEVIAKIKASL